MPFVVLTSNDIKRLEAFNVHFYIRGCWLQLTHDNKQRRQGYALEPVNGVLEMSRGSLQDRIESISRHSRWLKAAAVCCGVTGAVFLTAYLLRKHLQRRREKRRRYTSITLSFVSSINLTLHYMISSKLLHGASLLEGTGNKGGLLMKDSTRQQPCYMGNNWS